MKARKIIQLLALACAVSALLPLANAAELAHYNMEQSSSPLIDQVGGETAAATGSGHAYSQAGPVGWGSAAGLSANGSWQLDATESAELRALSNNFTVASWIYIEPGRSSKGISGNNRYDRIIGDDAAWDADGWSFGIENLAASRKVVFTKNGIIDGASPTTILLTEGVWHHVAARVTSSTGIEFFIDGASIGTNGNTADLNTGNGNNGQPDPYGIGRSYGSAQPQWFPGKLDEVRVFDTVLTQAEIAALMVPPSRDPWLVARPPSIQISGNNADTVQNIDVTVANNGPTQALQITGITVTGEDAGLFTVVTSASPGSPLTVPAAGGSGTIQLSFNPGGDPVLVDATLEITSNDSEVPVTSIPIGGAIRDPFIAGPTSIVVPTTTTNAPLPFEVEIFNDGQTNNLTLNGVFPGGTDAGYFQVVTDFTSPVVIPPGGSTIVDCEFVPNGEYRSFSARLEFDSDDLVQPTLSIPVTAELDFLPPPAGSLRLTGNMFSGGGTGLLWQPGAPVSNDSYDNTAVPPSSWANIYFDSDNDQAFTSPGDTSGNTNYTLEPKVVVSGSSPQVLHFYVQSFAHGATPSGVAANFAANAYRMRGLEMELSDGSTVTLDVKTGQPQTFTDPDGRPWTVVLNGVGLVGDVVSNINSIPGGGDDYHFTLTFTLGANFTSWAATNAPGQGIDEDHDNDGVPNGIEYFMGESGSGFTVMPTLVGDPKTITWPKGVDYSGVYATNFVVQTSDDLSGWNDVGIAEVTDSPTGVSYTLPTGETKIFVRLKVTGP